MIFNINVRIDSDKLPKYIQKDIQNSKYTDSCSCDQGICSYCELNYKQKLKIVED